MTHTADKRSRYAAFLAGEYTPGQPAAPTAPLNYLNINQDSNLKPIQDPGSSSNRSNLNGLKGAGEKRGGVPRRELYTDAALGKAMAWGVQEWLVQVSIREYGLYTVKATINRIHTLPEGYFKPQYGPLDGQRGRLFNAEMKKLQKARQAG